MMSEAVLKRFSYEAETKIEESGFQWLSMAFD